MPTAIQVLRERYDQIQRLQRALLDLKDEISLWTNFHPRAMKLIQKRKNFIVVAEDEPYFMEVYNLVRSNEITKDRWTKFDQLRYEEAMTRAQQ